jgi:hypothetical protein
MTLDILKKQATRLVAYLGAHHRVNIRHASALEAIAAVHGARNWPTLAARSGRPAVAQTSRGTPTQEHFALTWKNGMPAMTLSTDDWFRHTLATGEPDDCAYWLQQHIADCRLRGADGVFFNVLREKGQSTLLALHKGAPAAPAAYSLLAGLDPREATTMLMLAHPTRVKDGSLAAHDRQRCELLLEAVIFAIQERPRRLTVPLLLGCLEYTGMAILMAKTSEAGRERLRAILETIGDITTPALMLQVTALVKPLVQALSAMLAEPAALAVLDESLTDESLDPCAPARSVVEALGAGGLWHVATPEEGRLMGVLRQLWMQALVFALQRRRNILPANVRPMVVGCANAEVFSGPGMASLVSQARGVSVALLLTTSSEGKIGRAESGGEVLRNVRHRLHLGTPDSTLEHEVLRRLRASSAQLVIQDEVRF